MEKEMQFKIGFALGILIPLLASVVDILFARPLIPVPQILAVGDIPLFRQILMFYLIAIVLLFFNNTKHFAKSMLKGSCISTTIVAIVFFIALYNLQWF